MAERLRPRAPWWTKTLLGLVLAALYLPLLVMLVGAVFAPVQPGGERELTLHWFVAVLEDPDLMKALRNSLSVGLVSSVVTTLIGSLGAIALHRMAGRGRLLLESLNTVSLVFPEIVFALALLSWFFLLNLELGLTTVIIAHITFSLSYVLMTVASRLSSMDHSLEEAARDLGAGELQILFKVTLPLLSPALIAGFILSFLISFDDFLITYFVNGVGSDTLPVKLYTSMRMGVTPKLNALSSLMFLMTVTGLLIFSRTPAFKVLFENDKK